MNLARATADHIINYYCNKYKLSLSLSYLSLKARGILHCRHITYPDPIEDLILGYINFNTRSLLILPPKSSDYVITEADPIYKFFTFVYVFGNVLDKCSIDNREILLNRFKTICKADTSANFLMRNFRGFYHEIKTFFLLYFDGHILQCFTEKEGLPRGKSPPEAIFCDSNGQAFQVECKSISTASGHPIVKKTAEIFFNLLIKDPIYKDLYSENKNCCVEFKFAKRLSSSSETDCWSAEALLENLKKNLDIELTTYDEVRILEAWEYPSKLSKTRTMLGKRNMSHQMILYSLAPNNYHNEFQQKVIKAINKKNTNEIPFPTLYSIEIYGPSTIDGQYDTLLISDKIQLKNYKTQQLTSCYKVPWSEIMLEILSKINRQFKYTVFLY